MKWEKVAEYCEEIYGSFVDWEERFFICPECEDPIYEDDWDEGTRRTYQHYCPVCEALLWDEDED